MAGRHMDCDICVAYGDIHDIKCNHAKTVCMYLPSKGT